jgi:hypothetical protein
MLVAYGALAHHRHLLAGVFHPHFIHHLGNRCRQKMRGGVGAGHFLCPLSASFLAL